MRKRAPQCYFTEEFKRSAVSKVESGEQNTTELSSQYGIRGHSTILRWCRRYGGNQHTFMAEKQKKDIAVPKEDFEIELLRKQVSVLTRDLKDARLKQATLETLIDIAERHYSISIKKTLVEGCRTNDTGALFAVSRLAMWFFSKKPAGILPDARA